MAHNLLLVAVLFMGRVSPSCIPSMRARGGMMETRFDSGSVHKVVIRIATNIGYAKHHPTNDYQRLALHTFTQ